MDNAIKRLLTKILLVSTLTGCAALEGVAPPRDYTLEEVRHHVGINSLKINTLKARVEVTVESPELESPLACRGYLRMERPRRLRVVCSKLFSTIFDIVSNGQESWLYVPGEKKVYTGRADQNLTSLGLNFSPNDVSGLLDFEAELSSKRLSFEPTPEYWTIHVLDERGLTLSDLFVDKRTLQVSYIESFNPDGSLRMQATLGEYKDIGDCSLPRSLEIYWPAGDTNLTLNLSKVAINEGLDPKVFRLSIPQGVETVSMTSPKAVSQ